MLHITNGDSAANTIRQAPMGGDILSWQDLLHEGPTPAGLSLNEMSKVRARFIADCGWATYEDVLNDLARRDETLAKFHDHEEVILWFEHDLYDQLQLIQLLDWFARQDLGKTKLSLICIGEFPGIVKFHGLGQLSPDQVAALYDTRREVSAAELELGREAWIRFRLPDPLGIESLLSKDTSALPFLEGTLIRHLEQFPSVRNGLSRTERQILDAIATGFNRPYTIFSAAAEKEERVFMGDSTFFIYLSNLCRSKDPLLRLAENDTFLLPWECRDREEFSKQTLSLTEKGHEVLEGRDDWIRINGIDRWLGGVHLRGEHALWRWDEQNQRILR